MDTNKSGLKNNLIKLVLFFSVALISILLIMMSVSMFDLPTPDATGGVENTDTWDNDNVENNEDIEKQYSENSDDVGRQQETGIGEENLDNQDVNLEEQFNDWKEQARERKDEAFNPSLEEPHAQEEQNKSFLPDADRFDDDFLMTHLILIFLEIEMRMAAPLGETILATV